MTREPENGLLLGINLWEVRECRLDKSRNSGDAMLKIKLVSGGFEFHDIAMLQGKGWRFGKQKLMALGLAADFKGGLDPLQFVGKKVWVATKEGSYEYLDKKSGEKKTATKAEVDIDQLKNAGYQEREDVPEGATIVLEGLGPDDDQPPF